MAAKSKKRGAGPEAARSASAARRKRRRRSRRTLHHILLIVFLLAAGLLLCLTVFFKIEQVTVTGCDKYPETQLITASGIVPGDNLFRVPAGEIERRLEEDFPYIESARVRRKFPPSIEIEIVQSVPAAALSAGDEYVLVTKAGKVLERGLMVLSNDLLLVKGVDVTGRMPGDMLGDWTREARPSRDETPEAAQQRLARNQAAEQHAAQEAEGLKMLTYLLDAMQETGFQSLTNLDITDRLNMQVMFEGRLLLKLGSEADLVNKLLFVRLVVTEKLHPQAHGVLNAADISQNDWVIYTPASGYESDGTPIDSYTPT